MIGLKYESDTYDISFTQLVKNKLNLSSHVRSSISMMDDLYILVPALYCPLY